MNKEGMGFQLIQNLIRSKNLSRSLSHLSTWPQQSDKNINERLSVSHWAQSMSLITLPAFYGVICLYFWVDNSYTIQVLIQWDMFYIIGSCSFDEVNVCELVVVYHLPYQILSFSWLSFKTILSHYWAAAESKPSLRNWEGSKFEVEMTCSSKR